MSKPLMFWVALLLVFSGGSTIWIALRARSPEPAPRAVAQRPMDDAVDEARTLHDFQLTDQQGKKFSSDALRGQVWVGSFFFSSCPGFCVQQNQAVQVLQERFGKRGLKLVSITCDPGRDTPAVLSAYSQRFGAHADTWKFLTGDFPYIKKVGRDFFLVPVGKEQHGSHLVVFDRQGKLRGAYGATDTESFGRCCRLVDQLLDEPAGSDNRPAESTAQQTVQTEARS